MRVWLGEWTRRTCARTSGWVSTGCPWRCVGRWARCARSRGSCTTCKTRWQAGLDRLRGRRWSSGSTIRSTRHTRVVWSRMLWVLRVPIGRRVVTLTLRLVNLWADLSLSPFLLDGHFWVNPPVEAFAFLVTLDESVVLAKIVPNTRLPSAGCGLELVPRVLLLNVIVNLLEIHLARLRR